ncbi:MAG: UDP-N-acetylmuramoyl-tripeptide--D-alanyl-D-alanine ligase [Acidobacteriota bacterium]
MKTLLLEVPVIAVTGSSGKSTTKEMIAAILQNRCEIFKTPGNRNYWTATEKFAKWIRPSHQAVVLEYGIAGFGHLKRSCQIIRPNIGVITMVGTAHLGNFRGDVKRLALAKSELIQNMSQSGKLYINADDDNSKLLQTSGFKGKIIRIGIDQTADYQAFDVKYADQGMTFKVKLDGRTCSFFIPIYGRHNVYNALFAIAVTHALGYEPSDMQKGLANYTRLVGRLTFIELARNVTLIDDSYSANPNSVKAALDVLATVSKGSNIAVLSDMTCLGRYTSIGHNEVGRYIAEKRIDHLYTIGERAEKIGESAVKSGFDPQKVIHNFTKDELIHKLVETVKSNATVLVKGSHSTGMKEIVDALKVRLIEP